MIKTATVILHAFDRSGSTAIAKSLCQHPQIELFMQPFNSGSVRVNQYNSWPEAASENDVLFFQGLENNFIDPKYIKSHWFEKHSTTTEYVEGHLHVIKTTLNHFLVDWVNSDFPSIDQWTIWRDPWDILASLVRNDFIETWYGGALGELAPTIKASPILSPIYEKYMHRLGHPHALGAFLISVRLYFNLYYLKANRLIDYAHFSSDHQACLSHFVQSQGLDSFSFKPSENINLIGKDLEPGASHRGAIASSQTRLIADIFAPLISLHESRFSSATV